MSPTTSSFVVELAEASAAVNIVNAWVHVWMSPICRLRRWACSSDWNRTTFPSSGKGTSSTLWPDSPSSRAKSMYSHFRIRSNSLEAIGGIPSAMIADVVFTPDPAVGVRPEPPAPPCGRHTTYNDSK